MSTTNRPCAGKHVSTAAASGFCHFCKLAETNPAYASWKAGGVPLPVCQYLGSATGETVACKACGGRDAMIPVMNCGKHGRCTQERPVAGATYCGTCDDRPRPPAYYAQAAPADPWENPVAVPAPPPFTPRTKSRRAVVTVAAGERGAALLSISGGMMREYAARVGAEFVVSTWPGNPAFGMTSKFALGPIFAAFDECLYADADVLLTATTADLFALRRDPRAVLGYNDLPHVLMHAPEFPTEYQRVRESQKMPRAPIPWYLNTGLVVVSREHAPHIAPPSHPIPTVHCAEQHVWVARMYESGCPVEFMGDDHHHQWWIQGTMRDAPPWAALHFSGMGDDRRRLTEMAFVAGMR